MLGGVCYTVGAVLYGMGRKRKYMHSVFHLFVVAGSVLHLLAILLFVL
ncbi:MAG: hemolysin III family protein [Candidatus Ventricola sp.]